MTARPWTEPVDRRVLGGFVFVDAITNGLVVDPLRVTSDDLQFRVNYSNVYAIFDAPGFTGLTSQFNPDPTSWPPARNFEVTVRDASLHYLPRRVQVQAPQNLTAVFTPRQFVLYPSPSAEVAPNWAVVRASVRNAAGDGLPWAVVRVTRSDDTVAATGMSDSRGEALLAVTGLGVQVSASSTGAVTETTIPVTAQAWFDPGVLSQPAGWVPNPDDILLNLSNPALKTATITGALGARQTLFADITISL
jgi:hypothetical protein